MATGRSIMRVLCKVIQSQHPEYWALYRPTTHNKSLPTINCSDGFSPMAKLATDSQTGTSIEVPLLAIQ